MKKNDVMTPDLVWDNHYWRGVCSVWFQSVWSISSLIVLCHDSQCYAAAAWIMIRGDCKV